MKIVINTCWGGFGLSKQAEELLDSYAGAASESINYYTDRSNPILVRVVEELGEAANDKYAKLRIVNIPDAATDYKVQDYDGAESVIYVVNGKIKWA